MNIFIPIKHNSERVPSKNFREFKGKPLWKYCVERLNKNFTVWVDTDSPDILKYQNKIPNVNIFQRPHHLIGNTTSVVDLIYSFITLHNITEPICQVHVTSPFLQVNHIKRSFDLLNKGFDSVFGVTKIQKRFWGDNGLPLNHDPKNLIPTQNLKVWYEENSYLYTFYPEVIFECGNRIGEHFYMMEIGFPYNLDIDTEGDWNLINKI
jgi:CMP-N-acetylneuraminic acid synthetase